MRCGRGSIAVLATSKRNKMIQEELSITMMYMHKQSRDAPIHSRSAARPSGARTARPWCRCMCCAQAQKSSEQWSKCGLSPDHIDHAMLQFTFSVDAGVSELNCRYR